MTSSVTPFMAWNDSWLVGVAEFDAQHKNLVSLLNELHQSMSLGRGRTVIGDVLASLVGYTQSHFAAEERLMQKYNYPGLGMHKLEHDQLARKVLEFRRGFEAGNVTVSIEVMEFLKAWLRDHILGSDKRYAGFFASQGVR